MAQEIKLEHDDDGVPDYEPGTDGRRHDVPDRNEALERSRRLRTMQSFRHPPPRSLSSRSTAESAFRRMPSRSTGGSSMRSVGTNPTHGSPPRRSAFTASARSARLFLGPRSLGAE